MLKLLKIQNFALINKAEIHFQPGLNILTGESGAGKSILVNAINQLCGERSSFELIKDGSTKAIVEAEFDLTNNNELIPDLQKHDIDINDHHLIIRKELSSSGNSRIFINDSPVQLSVLNSVSSIILDLHGQHQHQVLLHPENHLPYLDSYANLQSSVKDFISLTEQYDNIKSRIKKLEQEQAQALQMTDLYNFQVKEIEEAELESEQLDKLKEELKVLTNFERIHQFSEQIVNLLSTGEANAAQQVSIAEESLKELSDIDEQFKELFDNLVSARQIIEEIGQFTERYKSNLEYDPERAEFLRQRIAQIEFMLKKYQKNGVEEILQLRDELKTKLSEADNFESHLKELTKQKSDLEAIILASGKELSIKRKESAREFEKKLSVFSEEIQMKNSLFEFAHSYINSNDSPFKIEGRQIKLLEKGFDEFLIKFSPNPGEQAKPINKIASGGEISRVMLALKSVLAEKDKIPVLVFDEIDSGISGKVAQVVGKKISDLSRYHQIICITHLPQIAAFADNHLKVAKETDGLKTNVSIVNLNFEDQVKEIANLLGGVDISKQALDNASQLINEASKIK